MATETRVGSALFAGALAAGAAGVAGWQARISRERTASRLAARCFRGMCGLRGGSGARSTRRAGGIAATGSMWGIVGGGEAGVKGRRPNPPAPFPTREGGEWLRGAADGEPDGVESLF